MSIAGDRVVIVGASAGGLSTAEALRRKKFTGRITLIGGELEPAYDRPPLSKQFLSGEWGPERLLLRDEAAIAGLDVDLRLGRLATGVDAANRVVSLDDSTEVGYDALVVATGVVPRRLPGTEGLQGVHVLRTLGDAVDLQAVVRPGRRLVVIGAGFLGAEVADVATRMGADVTVLEADVAPMAQALGIEAGRFLAELHREQGTRIRAGVKVTGLVSENGVVTGVAIDDGSVIPADDVLVAIGSVPSTDWLQGSGLPVQDGLVCDEYCAASPDVYGVGDVARWFNPLFETSMRIEHRTNAAEQGLAVAARIADPTHDRPFAPVPYVWSDQAGVKLQTYGYLRGHEEVSVVVRSPEDKRFLALYRRGPALTGVLACGISPGALRAWRSRIAARTTWQAALDAPETS